MVRAQVWALPADTDANEAPDAETATGTALSPTALSLPSWPWLLSPQHARVPVANSAQVWASPAAIAVGLAQEPSKQASPAAQVPAQIPSAPPVFAAEHAWQGVAQEPS